MKLISFATFALSMLLQSSRTVASLGKPQQHIERDQANDQDHHVSIITHRINEEATSIVDFNSLVQLLESDECAYLVESINDTTEQFLNDNDDDGIIEYLCSDLEAGQILRKEAQIEKGLDPDVFNFTCESALNTLLVQQKDTLISTISDIDVCKAEVQRELDVFKGSRRSLRSPSRRLGRYIIINKSAVSSPNFIPMAVIMQRQAAGGG
eukprot:249895_1